MDSGSCLKKVFFVRHGESESNILFDKGRKQEARSLPDPHLSDKGRRQAGRVAQDPLLADVLAQAGAGRGGPPLLVVVSPLRRALQTLTEALGGWLARRHAAGAPVRIELCPDIQEHGTGDRTYACDRGRPASVLREEFAEELPGLRFDSLPEDWCEEPKGGRGRSEAAVAARLARFTEWLQRQPEATVIVVGHSNVFFSLLEADFQNGEVRLYSIAAAAGVAAGPGTQAPTLPRELPLTPPWQPVWPRPFPPRSSLICGTPRCNFLVHSNLDMGGFCCIACFEGQGHGPKCERQQPRAGAKKLNRHGEVSWTEEERREALAALARQVTGTNGTSVVGALP
mmetsp:Transcript_133333/g.414612  ORF Transcript_133333/g.414612 Transcript_133333/m.414612 type:complete len:341 (+) Transcript_133333:19-1041(+)